MERSIVLAPDSFKNSLSAVEVSEIVAEELDSISGDRSWSIQCHPLADGGEGTVEAFVEAHDGTYCQDEVLDPLGRSVTARWGEFQGNSAVIAMAEASGYELLEPDERDPLRASTYGTGQLIRRALESGHETVYVGLGGSATVDGGMGMATALGYRFLDDKGNQIKVPEHLGDLDRIVQEDVPESLETSRIIACSDVDNPLLGDKGAAGVFAPQKGASDREVSLLEKNLNHWADRVESFVGQSVRNEPGAGAAGGLGFGLAAFLDAELRSGAECIMEQTGFNSLLENADVVITGEGSMDSQSLHGKTPVAVARTARRKNVGLVLSIAGQLAEDYEKLHPLFDVILSCTKRPVSLEALLDHAEETLRSTARDLGRILCLLETT